MKKIIVSILLLIGLFAWLGTAGLIATLPLCLIGMAKVTGPLFSVSATGKIADSIVFFPWKGRHVVRQWLKPANPQSADQGDMRQIVGALGRACSVVQTAHDFASEVRAYMSAGQTWVSAIVKYMVDNVCNDGTAWDALVTEKMAHPSQAIFDTKAGTLNLVLLNITYRGCASAASAGVQLYLLAKFATNWELLGTKGFQRVPYTKALFDWVEADIDDMITEFTTTA